MDIYEAIKTRKSVRSYKDCKIEQQKLERILNAGRLAPSAKNIQEWRFIVVKEKATRENLAKAAAGQSFVAQAPVVIVCCAETDKYRMRCGLECYPIDVAIAIDHMTLAAVAEDLGTCWIGAFNQDEVKKILGIPKEVIVVALLPLGYPEDPGIKQKNRRSLAELIHTEKW